MTDNGSSDEFRVRDRRAFRDDGSRRREDDAARPEPEPSAAEAGTRGPEPAAQPETSDPEPETSDPEPDADVRFATLVNLLFSQALAMADAGAAAARESKDPEAHRQRRLDGLQEMIGFLEMLEEKTAGRLAAADSRFLEQVLFQLRMKFLAIRRGDA